MNRSCYFLAICMMTGAALSAAAQDSKPAAAPAPPPLIGSIAGHPDWPAAKNAADVDSADHLVAALYDVISGPPGKRDWVRFKSLFVPDGRIGVVVPASAATKDKPAKEADVYLLTPQMYEDRDDTYFSTHGFFERSIANRTEEFGNLVSVWSTYESRNNKDDAKPFSRGINSIQIAHARGRFWIVSVLFDDEREGLTLPEKYLK